MDKRNTAINLIANLGTFIITFLINFFLTPFIVGTLGTEAYGFVQLSNNIISYISIITIALNSMANRFISIEIYKLNYEKAKIYFSSVVLANAILSVVVLVLFIPIINYLEVLIKIPGYLVWDVKVLLFLLLCNFLLSLMASIYNVAIFIKNKLYLNSIRSFQATIIKAIILVGMFTLYRPKLYYIGISTLIMTGFIIIWNYYYTKKFTPELKISKGYFELEAIKKLLSSGIWNSINRLSDIINQGLALLITNIFISPEVMGILAISKTVPTQMFQILSSISGVFNPNLIEAYAHKNLENMEKILFQSIKIMGILLNIPIALFIVFGNDFYSLWLPTQDSKILYILSVIAIVPLIVSGPTASIYEVFAITNKLKLQSIVMSLLSLFNIGLVLILLKFTNLGVYAVVGVNTITSLLRNLIFTLPYAARCINKKWYMFYKPTLKSIITVIITIMCSLFIKSVLLKETWISLIGSVSVTGIISLVINSCIILGKNDRIFLFNKAKGIINKK